MLKPVTLRFFVESHIYKALNVDIRMGLEYAPRVASLFLLYLEIGFIRAFFLTTAESMAKISPLKPRGFVCCPLLGGGSVVVYHSLFMVAPIVF